MIFGGQMIKFDSRNYRKHNDLNKKLIRKSLQECGAGRSIVIDSENEIVAGNGIYEQAKKLGIKTKIIETDGSELVVVKRTDLKTQDEKRKKLAVMDNSASDTSEFDIPLLQEDFSLDELESFGIDIPNILEDDTEDDFYTKNINIPQYEPKGEDYRVSELYDLTKQKELIKEIKKSSLSDEQKEFLIMAANRHIKFNYKKIAEYYAKTDYECKKLMEDSALVIIDYADALKNGYVKLSKTIEELLE